MARLRVWPLLVAGFFLRGLVLPTSHPWLDEAVIGLMGLRVLQGDLPVFMSGQAFMGAFEAYLMAPPFAVLGPSALTLAILPFLLSCLTLALTWHITRELFDRRVAWITTALLAMPSNFLLWWSHQARSHYPLVVILGLLILWLTSRLSARRDAAARTRGYLVLGLLAGLAWWTNFLSVVYLMIVGVWLVWQERTRLFRPRLIGLTFAFIVGSSPLWLYNLSRGYFLLGVGVFESPDQWVTYLWDFVANALPILLGVPGPIQWTPFWLGGYLLTLVLLLFGLGIFLSHHRRQMVPAKVGALALLAVGAVNLLITLVSVYGSRLSDHDQKYLFPLTTVLPVLLAHGSLALWDRWRPLGILALLLPLTLNLAGSFSHQILWLRPAALAEFRGRVERDQAILRLVETQGIRFLYGPDWMRSLVFLSGEQVLFADPYQDNYPPYALQVDGAGQAAWFALGRDAAFESTLAATGIRFEVIQSPVGWIYHHFSRDPIALQELPPDEWRATANPLAEAAELAIDRDAGTRWESRGPQRPGMSFTLDLGRSHLLGMVSWLPGTFQDVPRGVRLETSVDGQQWSTMVNVPSYQSPLYWGWAHPMARVRRGRVELRFPPHQARHMRLTQTGEDSHYWWTIRELYVHTVHEGSPPETSGVAPLVARLRERGVRFVYADQGVSTQIALMSAGTIGILPQNFFTDSHGWREPDPDLPDRIRFRRGYAIVVPNHEAPDFDARARELGILWEDEQVGGWRLYTRLRRQPLVGRPFEIQGRVTASERPQDAGLALDGQLKTQWRVDRQRPGSWFQVDLSTSHEVSGLLVNYGQPSHELPRAFQLLASLDGARWEPLSTSAVTVGPLRWDGRHLLRDGVEQLRVTFPPRQTRFLRLVLIGPSELSWTVPELRLLAPGLERKGSP